MKKSFFKFHIEIFDYQFYSLLLIFLSSLYYLSGTYFSGMMTSSGIKFLGVNGADGVVHIARIKDFLVNFPPMHPGLAHVEFRGYHYFYDFLIAKFVMLFHFNIYDLYFRDFSFFVAILFGLSFLYAAKEFGLRKSKIIVIFMAYFTPGFFALVNYFGKQNIDLSILNPSNYIYDPSILLSLSILITLFAIMCKSNKNFWYAIICGMLLGVLCQIKIYAGLAGIVGMFSYGVYVCFLNKRIWNTNYIIMLGLAGFLTMATFLPNNFGSGTFVYAPFLFYRHFATQPSLTNWHWDLKMQVFEQHHNLPRIIILYGEAIGLFALLAFGMRLIVLTKIFRLRSLEFWKAPQNIVYLSSIIVLILIPTFFIQSVSVFDIGQFIAVAIILLTIPSVYVISQWYRRFPFFVILLIGIIVGISLLDIVSTVQKNIHASQTTISHSEISVFDFATQSVNSSEYIVFIPTIESSNNNQDKKLIWTIPSLVGAMTGRSVYVENEIIENPHNSKLIRSREQQVIALSSGISSCSEKMIHQQLEKIGTKFILTQQPENCLKNISRNFKESSTISFYHLK